MLISLPELTSRYGVRPTEVMHLGAHHAEEAAAYAKAGVKRVIWIEGNPDLIPAVQAALAAYPGQVVYNVLVSDVDGIETDFHITNNPQSSSILPLGTHAEHHPDIHVHKTVRLTTRRMDHFLDETRVDTSAVNFLNIDLQGVELAALRGLGRRLESIAYIYTEVNTGEVYRGCTTIGELDRFLLDRGFARIATRITTHQWGDALYVRKAITLRDTLRSRGSLAWLAVREELQKIKRWARKMLRVRRG